MNNPHQVTKDFESALCEYTGAPYAVTTTSCTMAILMAAVWLRRVTNRSRYDNILEEWVSDADVFMPKRSYVGVPASLMTAGFKVRFRDQAWSGEYQIEPLPLWDSARKFTSGMYRKGQIQCLSFHWSKILGLSQGGAILHDDEEADAWLRRARFDGRKEGVPPGLDKIQYPSWHAYISPEVSAQGLMKLASLPKHNFDLPLSDYPDLSFVEAFK
jgi:dTDP-4-amino-4,6-dideoxygalactose transaminase